MHRFLLSASCLALLALGTASTGQAQTILAGQVASATYTDLIPDKVLQASRIVGMTNSEMRDSLDLDGNGTADIGFRVFANAIWTSGQSAYALSRITPLHANVSLPTSSPVQSSRYAFGYALTKRLLDDDIQATLAAVGNMQQGSWHDGPADLYSDYQYKLSEVEAGYNSPNGKTYTGFWGDGQDGYLPVRLRTSSNAAWRYGWVRIQVLPIATDLNAAYVQVIIKDYALAGTTPAVQPTQVADWQVYPIPVANQLILVPPTAAGPGQVTVRDIYGQPVLRAEFSGRRQQLNLTGLTTGIYVVQVDTPAGRFTQRITKQ